MKRILHNLESGLISGSGDNGTLAAEVTKPKTELNTNAGKVRLNPQMAVRSLILYRGIHQGYFSRFFEYHFILITIIIIYFRTVTQIILS